MHVRREGEAAKPREPWNERMIKLGSALVMLAGLAAMSWVTLSDPRFRAGTLLVLGGCAVKIWIERRRRILDEQDGSNGRRE